MFERFARDARDAVVGAQEAARELGHDYVGCEHLLLGLVAGDDTVARQALTGLGATGEAIREAVLAVVGTRRGRPDSDALSHLGIDLDEVRRRAEEAFGPGALERTRAARRAFGRSGSIPFTPRAKHALELALRACVARRDNAIRSEHVLLGVLDQGSNLGVLILERLGLTSDAVRRALLERLDAAA